MVGPVNGPMAWENHIRREGGGVEAKYIIGVITGSELRLYAQRIIQDKRLYSNMIKHDNNSKCPVLCTVMHCTALCSVYDCW